MCDGAGDIEDLNSNSELQLKRTLKKYNNKCKKCEETPILLLQKKDPFCRLCFFEYCNHKFRSTIGKSKKIKHGDKVLLACSGGRKSAAMLHMTKQALDSASAKQISFKPGVLFIDETVISSFLSAESADQSDELVKSLKNFGYPVFLSRLEMVSRLNRGVDFYWSCDSDVLPIFPEVQNWFKECLAEMSLTEKFDLIKHLRLLLMTEIANDMGYDYLFLGDSGDSLAIDLLTDISLGRGSQISSDTNFFDSRFKVPVCRPIREFLNKELLLYTYFHNCSYCVVPDLLTKTEFTSCIQRLTECFISELQENFPATVFTIFRTGGKLLIDSSILASETCLVCKSKLDNVNLDPCSAIEALKVSERLSIPMLTDAGNCEDSISKMATEFEDMNIMKRLCHACLAPFKNKNLKNEDFFANLKM